MIFLMTGMNMPSAGNAVVPRHRPGKRMGRTGQQSHGHKGKHCKKTLEQAHRNLQNDCSHDKCDAARLALAITLFRLRIHLRVDSVVGGALR